MTKTTSMVLKNIRGFLCLFLGTFLAAVALEFILIPNKIIDGGVVGISIMVSHLTKIPVSVYTFLLNIPFLFFGYKQIGKTFVVKSLFSIVSLSMWLTVLSNKCLFTQDVLLASVFGGILLGIGVGIVIRFGGSLDGTEMIAIVLDKKTAFSVGQIVMFFNLFILSSAGLVFTPDRAMYSLITYFVAYKFMDMMVEGIEKEKAILIITDKGDEIAQTITARLGRGVTFLEGKGGYSKSEKQVLYSVITRLEIAKLKDIIKVVDQNAFVTVSDVSDVVGGKNRKNASDFYHSHEFKNLVMTVIRYFDKFNIHKFQEDCYSKQELEFLGALSNKLKSMNFKPIRPSYDYLDMKEYEYELNNHHFFRALIMAHKFKKLDRKFKEEELECYKI